MKKLTTVLFAVALSLSALAQITPPVPVSSDEIPIASEAMLDAYAYSLVNSVEVQMWASSAVQNFYTNVPYLGPVANPTALRALANSIVPKITLANMQDRVSYYVSYNGIVGDMRAQLFYGQADARPVSGKGGWTLPTFKIQAQRSDWIPWKTKKGLSNAYMIIRDEDGNIVDYYYFSQDKREDLENGILWLGSQHVNRRGEVYLSYRDKEGNVASDVYNLGTGKQIKPEVVSSQGVLNDFAGLVILPDNVTRIAYKAVEGEPNLFYAPFTQFTVVDVSYQAPPGVEVQIFAIDAEDLAENPDGWHPVKPSLFWIDAGRRLFFRFEWGPPNTNPIPKPTYPNGGGGKG